MNIDFKKIDKRIVAKTVIIVLGLGYTLLPHRIHMKYSPEWLLGFHVDHYIHVMLGIALLIIGLVI